MSGIVIKNGRIIDPANKVDAKQDLYLLDGIVVGLGSPPPGFISQQEINAQDRIVCPGLIDLSARLREPGQEHKGNIASETTAAASGGITTLCCPPDTHPCIDNPAIAAFITQRARQVGQARVVTLGALTKKLQGEHLSEMGALQKAGCVGVSNAYHPIKNTQTLRHSFEYAATLDLKVFINAEDPWLAEKGCMHEGEISTRLGLVGIPITAETIAIARDLQLIEQTGVRAHFSHLSSGAAVEMIASAQARGLPVTADVAAHHLYLTDIDVCDFNTQCHVRPPLRSLRDQTLLRLGLTLGTISAICSDHQPHEADAKLLPFAATEPGISGLETLLPLTLRLVNELDLTLSQAIALLTQHPANILGINAGHLSLGAIADICIIDTTQTWTVDPGQFLSKGRNTPFAGWELQGKVMQTFLAGKIIYQG